MLGVLIGYQGNCRKELRVKIIVHELKFAVQGYYGLSANIFSDRTEWRPKVHMDSLNLIFLHVHILVSIPRQFPNGMETRTGQAM